MSVLARWALVVLVGVGVGAWAHEVGSDIAQERVRELEQTLRGAKDETMRLQSEVAGLHAALRTERDRVAEWQERSADAVPDRAEQGLLQAARERHAKGVTRDGLNARVPLDRTRREEG